MNAEEFGTALVGTARKYLYVREKGANTDNGGFVDQSLAALGLPPGNSWCAAAVCAWVKEAVASTGATVTWHRSARALGCLELNESLKVDPTDVQPGDVLVEDHGGGLGHISVVTDVVRVNGVVAGVSTIAGNTSADGHSRNGDRVAEHPISWPDGKLAGILRITPAA